PGALAVGLLMPARPVGQTFQSTLPYGVGTLPPLTRTPTLAGAAGEGSSLAAARPGGDRDGGGEGAARPLGAVRTPRGAARSLPIGPVIAGTINVPSGASRARPGCAGWPRTPSTVPAGTPPR